MKSHDLGYPYWEGGQTSTIQDPGFTTVLVELIQRLKLMLAYNIYLVIENQTSAAK